MNRRNFLQTVGASTTIGLAGCIDNKHESLPNESRVPSGNVYYPPEIPEWSLGGMKSMGDFSCAFLYGSAPPWWAVSSGDSGLETAVRNVGGAANVYVVAIAFDDSGNVRPSLRLRVDISETSGNSVHSDVARPALSEQLGFHYGGSVKVSEEETYTATIRGTELNVPPLDDGGGAPFNTDSASFSFSMDNLPKTLTPEQAYQKGALSPVLPTVPKCVAPQLEQSENFLGSVQENGVVFSVVESPGRDISSSESELLVYPSTPYNEYLLPGMSINTSLVRNGSTVFSDNIRQDSSLSSQFVYRTSSPSVMSGDEITLDVLRPPMLSRLPGYEQAFVDSFSTTLVVE